MTVKADRDATRALYGHGSPNDLGVILGGNVPLPPDEPAAQRFVAATAAAFGPAAVSFEE
jgi:hypothetical protein